MKPTHANLSQRVSFSSVQHGELAYCCEEVEVYAILVTCITETVVTGLTPFTTYICTVHAVTVSDGPKVDPMNVTTSQQGMV